MLEGEANPHFEGRSGGGAASPIQLLVNYWEFRASVGSTGGGARKHSMMAERLDQLLRQGITHLVSFVPWQVVEADISHALTRFLQAAGERKINVSLILTPEVGVHCPNSGLPKDVISRRDDMAQHQGGGAIPVTLPPNAFTLPSLFAPDFNKRFYGFLSRIDTLLSDLAKSEPSAVENVTLILSGSFWKYYRSPKGSASSGLGAFGGLAGDYSSSAGLAFRQRLDQHYTQREFCDPNPQSANRWKERSVDETNRRWFFQQSEDVFRTRTFQLVRRKAPALSTQEIELYTPEADPAFAYSHFLQLVSGGHADSARLSDLIDDASTRASMAAQGTTAPFIHWSSLGGFRTLADSEKQFLILKSLLLMGAQGGGVLVDEADWFSLSASFRARAEGLARLISTNRLVLRNEAFYLAPHLWSPSGSLWKELRQQVGYGAKVVSSLDLALRDRNAKLLVVDPAFVMTREIVAKLVAWARSGRVVVVPRTPLFTEAAKRELAVATAQSRRMEIDLGIPYQLHVMGEGSFVIYDPAEGVQADGQGARQIFMKGMLSVAEIEIPCGLSDSRLSVIPLEKKGGGHGLFVLNKTRRQVTGDLFFASPVRVSDFASAFATGDSTNPSVLSNRFALEVAPFGILALAIEKGEEKQLFEDVSARPGIVSPISASLPALPGRGSVLEESL